MAGKAHLTSQHVRKTFLKYFKGCDHKFVASSSVIPKKGQGTYFVNAGMNQVSLSLSGLLMNTQTCQFACRYTLHCVCYIHAI